MLIEEFNFERERWKGNLIIVLCIGEDVGWNGVFSGEERLDVLFDL